jgi:uncharacterized damage-inducible protein DinB
MDKFKKWLDRDFDLDIPLWMFPNLVERLRGTPARAKDRIEWLPEEILTRRFENAWSIQENIGHLLDVEPLWSGRLDDFESGKEVLRPAAFKNRKREKANHNMGSINEILSRFRESRDSIVRRIESYNEDFILRPALHPRLNKPMNVLGLMLFIAEHDDHHLALISQIFRPYQQRYSAPFRK